MRRKDERRAYPLCLRCQRVFLSILRCLCLRIFLRRFLTTELTRSSSRCDLPAAGARDDARPARAQRRPATTARSIAWDCRKDETPEAPLF